MSPWDTFGNRVRRVMFRSLLRRGVFDRLHIDHELLYDKASRWAARSRSKTELVLTPNPILLADPMNKADARRELGLPVSGRLVTTTGMIASWKGVDRLLAAFLQFTEGSGSKVDDRLLLSGPHSDEIREILGQPAYRALVERGQIVSIDRFLNEQQMFTCAAAGDLTAAVYPHPSGRSSIILWAAAAGRPSLGTDAGCIGYVIRQQRLGLTAESLAPQPLARQIEQALAMPWTDDDVARVRQYASTHSVENYQRVACDFVRRRLGVNAPVT